MDEKPILIMADRYTISPVTKALKKAGLKRKTGKQVNVFRHGRMQSRYVYGAGDYIITRPHGMHYCFIETYGGDSKWLFPIAQKAMDELGYKYEIEISYMKIFLPPKTT